jgi:hypothetical protein
MRLRLAALALLVPLAAACGSDTPAKLSALDVVRQASQKTVETGSARMEMRIEAEGFSMTGNGVTSLKDTTGQMTMVMEAGGQQQTMEYRMLGDVMYMKMPGLPVAKEWVKLDLKALGETQGVDLQALTQMRDNDPTQSLAYLSGVSEDVRVDGEEDIRGAHTTRYKATFDLNKAAAQTPEAKEKVDKLIQQMGTSTMPATVWIDDDGRMRKMTYDIDLSKASAAAGARGTMTTTFEMYDFGAKVDVQAPPAADTADGAQLFAQLQQGGS